MGTDEGVGVYMCMLECMLCMNVYMIVSVSACAYIQFHAFKPELSEPILKNLGFSFFLKPKNPENLGFLGFLFFKSEFLLFHVKLCKFLRIH